jgi:hypothetical protein
MSVDTLPMSGGQGVASLNLASPTSVWPCQRHSAHSDPGSISAAHSLLSVHCACNQVCWTWKLWCSRGYIGRRCQRSESLLNFNFEAV